jgi:serine/threonine protein kinase
MSSTGVDDSTLSPPEMDEGEKPVSSSSMFGSLMFERTSEVIGSGAFATVYKGRNRVSGASVAVKVFRTDSETTTARFQHTIRCFEKISNMLDRSNSSPSTQSPEIASVFNSSTPPKEPSLMSYRPPTREVGRMLKLAAVKRELIVGLLDYSRGVDGRPGADEKGEFWLVMELGDFSLEEYIDYRKKRGRFSESEIRALIWDITRMACLLHSQGLAHLDIKPANIMLFNGTHWKLIDFDGCFISSTVVDVLESDVAFTPLYCAPEIAATVLDTAGKSFRISRLMDVWSVGAIAAELILMTPLFEREFVKRYKNEDDTEFLAWLADPDTKIDLGKVEAVARTTPGIGELVKLLKTQILIKNPKHRISLPEILQNTFFATNFTSRQASWTPTVSLEKKKKVGATKRFLSLYDKSVMMGPDIPTTDTMNVLLQEFATAPVPELIDAEHATTITPLRTPRSASRVSKIMHTICCRWN